MIHDMPADEYHAEHGLSSSIVRTYITHGFGIALRMFRGEIGPPKSTPSMRLGTAVHSMLLEHELEAMDAEQLESIGHDLTPANQRRLGEIAGYARHASAWREILDEHELRELTISRVIDGVLCKGRIDACAANYTSMIDLKTTSSGISLAEPYWYIVQLAWYAILLEEETGVSPEARILWVRTTSPPAFGVDAVSSFDLDRVKALLRGVITFFGSAQHLRGEQVDLTMPPRQTSLSTFQVARLESAMVESVAQKSGRTVAELLRDMLLAEASRQGARSPGGQT